MKLLRNPELIRSLFSHTAAATPDAEWRRSFARIWQVMAHLVAALDHSEVVTPELARKEGETTEQRTARMDGWIANRVPDIGFLIDHMLSRAWNPEIFADPSKIGIVGHSFGGWTVLSATEADPAHPGRGGSCAGWKLTTKAGTHSGKTQFCVEPKCSNSVSGCGRRYDDPTRWDLRNV